MKEGFNDEKKCVVQNRKFAQILFFSTSNSSNIAVGTREKTYSRETQNFVFRIISVFEIS